MRIRALLLIAAATAGLVTGCSGGSEDSPVISAPTATPTTQAPPTSAPAVTTTRPAPATTTNPPVETAPPLGRPACRGADLTVTDADSPYDASYYRELYAVRTTGPDCQLKGYPTVQIAGVTTQDGGFGLPPEQPQTVTLSRSTSLSFVISSPRTGSCRQISTIVVTLPGTSTGHRTSTSLTVCGSKVGLSPVHRQGDRTD